MDEEMQLLQKRLMELSERAWNNSQYLFTDFLNESELAVYYSMQKKLSPSGSSVFGGYDDAGRCMVRFGSPEVFGYEEQFPVKCVKAEPLIEKFAEDLTHRDFLGSLMNLQIKREVTGDLLTDGKVCYIFCEDRIADFICSNLDRVRHTSVKCRIVNGIPDDVRPRTEKREGQIASERIDGFVAEICNVSRSASLELFRTQKVFLNGCTCENNTYQMKQDDVLSVRGYGKFRYLGSTGTTRKGNLFIEYLKYI